MKIIICWDHKHDLLIEKLLLTSILTLHRHSLACITITIVHLNLKEWIYDQITDLHKINIIMKTITENLNMFLNMTSNGLIAPISGWPRRRELTISTHTPRCSQKIFDANTVLLPAVDAFRPLITTFLLRFWIDNLSFCTTERTTSRSW